jgi:hypothetical protein
MAMGDRYSAPTADAVRGFNQLRQENGEQDVSVEVQGQGTHSVAVRQ